MVYSSVGDISYMAEANWAEVAPGIWFPMSGVSSLYGDDPAEPGNRAVAISRLLTVQSVQFGQLAGDDFEIEFPIGAQIYDHIIGLAFAVGGDGQLNLARENNIVALAPSNQNTQPNPTSCGSECTSGSSCDQTNCSFDGSVCKKFTGGSYSTCEDAQSGTCTTTPVDCGLKTYCDEDQGGCRPSAGNRYDCSCIPQPHKVDGCQ